MQSSVTRTELSTVLTDVEEIDTVKEKLVGLLRSTLDDHGLCVDQDAFYFLEERMERGIERALSTSESREELLEKLEILKHELMIFLHRSIEAAEGRHITADLFKNVIYYICCVMGLDFEFLCAGVLC